MNLQSVRHSIAGPVAAVAVAFASLAGVTTTVLEAGSPPAHVAGQVVPPSRVLPPDPCRSAC